MRYAPYREIPDLLKTNQSFRGHTMHARFLAGEYRVYSYGTLIYHERDGRCLFYNDHKYSATTSRHQRLLYNAKFQQITRYASK